MLDPHPFLDRRIGIGFEDAFDMTQVDVEGAGIEAGDFVGDGERLALRFVRFRFLGGQDQDLAGQRNDFIKQVNASIVDPGFIASVRRKLALDQREAAEIFGGGVNAFSRYENGKTKPPLALVKLLKVLDRHPDLLDEVKAA